MTGEERDLWQARAGGSGTARAHLVAKYEHLVAITRKRRFPNISGDFAEELEAEGRLALVRCVDRFDPTRPTSFSSYAITYIWGAMAEVCRREDWVPRSERRKQKDGEAAVLLTIEPLEAETEPEAAFDEEGLLTRMQAGALERLIHYLPTHERRVVQQHVIEERALTTLEEELGRSSQTLARWRDSGLKRLRLWLQRTGAIDAT